ncbi:MAG: UDP-N-acetylglucosamine 2-epimerase (hydrolyzing) [Rhodothermales bacterium]|nr:UDP-N-acetylglucosamine 2-epimerase (hydrolyzing) [Rhodothermales bacterium]
MAVLTVARSDFGIYRPVLRAVREHPDLELRIIATGTHLSERHGATRSEILEAGFEIDAEIPSTEISDAPEDITRAMGTITRGMAQALARLKPDWLLVLGDRYEMHAGTVAALPFRIPVAHIHGGEVTEGAFDDSLRHAVTKLSHLHFATTEDYARRIRQLGEEDWRVHAVGSPNLDNLTQLDLLSREELWAHYAWPAHPTNAGRADRPFVMVTFHPVTLQWDESERHLKELLAAARAVDAFYVFSGVNADTGANPLAAAVHRFVKASVDSAAFVESFGVTRYFSALACADAMLGNSSSGILESPLFELPVVNVGDRQKGRIRGNNVIDVPPERGRIEAALRRALTAGFRAGLRGMHNPYGTGGASEAIAEAIARTPINQRLIQKAFIDR